MGLIITLLFDLYFISSVTVIRVAVKSKTERLQPSTKNILPKPETSILKVSWTGCKGDYNHYRTARKNTTNNWALSIVTTNAISQLHKKGFPEVKPGDLGENITLDGQNEKNIHVGDIFKLGQVEFQICENIEPCNNLGFLPYVGTERRREFLDAINGIRGWYARVLKPGIIKKGDKLQSSHGLLYKLFYEQKPGYSGNRWPEMRNLSIISKMIENPVDDIKCVVFGVKGVGKSSLVESYFGKSTNQRKESVLNLPFNLQVREVEGSRWSTFKTQKGEGILLVYDINDLRSFEFIYHHCDSDLIMRKKGILVLIGNKCDTVNNRKVSFEEGILLAKALGDIPFIETSAKTGAHLEEVFKTISESVLLHRCSPKKLPL